MLRRFAFLTFVSLLVVACFSGAHDLEARNEAVAESSRSISGPRQRSLAESGIVGLDTRVNLHALDSWSVAQLIEFLAHRGGVSNIVIGPGIEGLTTRLKFDDVTVGEALEVVLSVNNLAYVVRGGILTILTDSDYQQQFGTSFYDQKEVRMLQLRYVDPLRVQELLQPIKSSIGVVVADQSTGTMVLIDTPAKVGEMVAVALAADIPTLQRQIPTETKLFVLQHADVDEMQKSIASMLTPEIGRIRLDQRTRTLMVTDLPHRIREVEQLVTAFDRRSRQVFIEAKIVQVALRDQFRMGINWNYLFQGNNPGSSSDPAIVPSAGSTRAAVVMDGQEGPRGGVTYRTISGSQSLDTIVQALTGMGETRILSNPHIAVIDGEKAEIRVVTREPYSEAHLAAGSTNVVAETFQFVDVGVSLDVTPRINDMDMISMTIRPEISSVVSRYRGAISATDGVPIVRTSYADTMVSIKNGETIIIAGMIENEQRQDQSRIPLLGRIPVLGALFRQKKTESTNRELIVFLTPRIVSGERPYLRMRDVKKSPKPMRQVAPPENERPIRGLR
jgi:type II secretory pathway component GspD/PulD (secretin)